MSSHFITTNNADGKGVFSSVVPTECYDREMVPGAGIDQGSTHMVYTTHGWRPDLSTEVDIHQYSKDRVEGLPPGQICPPNGTATGFVTLGPNCESMWHRTLTVDVIYIIEGVVEMHLDSGEMRVLKAGDTLVQRGTMHRWKNITPDGGVYKAFGIGMPCAGPIVVGEKRLETEWKAIGEGL